MEVDSQCGVDFGATDLAPMAQAFGGHGVKIADANALEREVVAALNRTDTFTLLAIEIGPRAYDGRF